MAIGLVAGPLLAADAAAEPILDRDTFLRAVAEVETGGNARAIGQRGERGLYQFTRATWRRHSSRPFTDAHNPTVAYQVAVEHFNWLQTRISASGREPTNYRMAVAWNAGLGRALGGSVPRSTRDYARRVSNLAAIWQPARSGGETLVASATAPARTVAASAPALARVVLAPEVAPVDFTLGRPETFRLGPLVSEAEVVSSAEPASEVTFTLAPASEKEESARAPARRFIFATIGE